MKQKDVILEEEGDAWFNRNHAFVNSPAYREGHWVSEAVAEVVKAFDSSGAPERPRLLEIGCGEACRLEWLASELDVEAFGVEPSALAVEAAVRRGLDVLCDPSGRVQHRGGGRSSPEGRGLDRDLRLLRAGIHHAQISSSRRHSFALDGLTKAFRMASSLKHVSHTGKRTHSPISSRTGLLSRS